MLNDIAEDQKTREKEMREIYREKERDSKAAGKDGGGVKKGYH